MKLPPRGLLISFLIIILSSLLVYQTAVYFSQPPHTLSLASSPPPTPPSSSPHPLASSNPTLWVTYHHPSLNLSFRHPNTWSIQPISLSGIASSLVTETYWTLSSTHALDQSPPSPATLEFVLLDPQKNKNLASLTDCTNQLINCQPVTYNHIPFQQITIPNLSPGQGEILFTTYQQFYLLIVITLPSGSPPTLNSTIQQILSSLSLS